MTSQLRPALLMNAALSLATGALMLVAPRAVSSWLGLDIAGWLRAFGAALVGHAALIAFLLPRMELRRLGMLNVVAIAPYPLAMIGLVAGGFIDRSLGQGLALADGAAVGAIAVVHLLGLRNVESVRHPQAA